MKQLADWSSIYLAAVAMLATIGCAKSEYDWATVRGTVTIDGQPVPRGSVTFSPTGTTRGPVAGTSIENGQYECEKVPPGQHTVLLSAEAEEYREFTDATGAKRRVPRSILPPHYNEGLPADIKPGENQLDFALSSTGK